MRRATRARPRRGRSRVFTRAAVLATALLAALPLAAPAQEAPDPADCRAWYNGGEYARCLEAIEAGPSYFQRNRQMRILAMRCNVALGQVEPALGRAAELARYYPNDAHALMAAYEVFRTNGRAEDAARCLGLVHRVGRVFSLDFMDAREIVALGRSALLLGGEPRMVLEQLYDRALGMDRDCLEAYIASGQLGLDKYDRALAADQFRKGLARAPENTDLLIGLAHALLGSDRGAAVAVLEKLLEINPRHAGAHTLVADLQIDAEDYSAAHEALDKAVEADPEHPLAWTYRAAVFHLENDPDAAGKARAIALKRWPENPAVDHTIGKKLAEIRRFAEGVTFQRRALDLDPYFLPAKVQLAQDLLRTGDDEAGWKLVEQVHQEDGYNVVIYNLATLRDHLESFASIAGDDFVLRLPAGEAEVYGERALALLREARAALAPKYGLDLEGQGPVLVEFFDNEQDFAVRTFGVPVGAGILGACFGSVVTMNSPGGLAAGNNNWEAVLWHEYCHVVTLGATANKMPRWLSEGISVYEEWQRDASWGQRMTPENREKVLDEEALLPIAELSSAFLGGGDMLFGYFQSALVVEYLIERFGQEAFRSILRDLAAGTETNAAIEKHTVPMAELEEAFAEHARGLARALAPGLDFERHDLESVDLGEEGALARWLQAHPDNYWGMTVQIHVLLRKEQAAEAKALAERLVELYPDHYGDGSPYLGLAEANRQLGDEAGERQALEHLASRSSDALPAYHRLIEIAEAEKDWAAVEKNAGRCLAINPMLPRHQRALAVAAAGLGRKEEAAGAFRRVIRLGPENPAEAHFSLARLTREDDPEGAFRHTLDALAHAPRFRDAHRLLLDLRAGREARAPEEALPTPGTAPDDPGDDDAPDEPPAPVPTPGTTVPADPPPPTPPAPVPTPAPEAPAPAPAS